MLNRRRFWTTRIGLNGFGGRRLETLFGIGRDFVLARLQSFSVDTLLLVSLLLFPPRLVLFPLSFRIFLSRRRGTMILSVLFTSSPFFRFPLVSVPVFVTCAVLPFLSLVVAFALILSFSLRQILGSFLFPLTSMFLPYVRLQRTAKTIKCWIRWIVNAIRLATKTLLNWVINVRIWWHILLRILVVLVAHISSLKKARMVKCFSLLL